jgi:hypothetical protein
VPIFRIIGAKGAVLLIAVVLPLLALIGIGLRGESRTEQTEARHRALSAARSVAARLDVHFRDLENLLTGLSDAVSTNPNDIDANDALLRRVKSEMPSAIANILLLSLDGRSIGDAVGQHASAGDRDYFHRALAGDTLVVGDPIRSRSNLGWVIPVARAVKNSVGETQAVLVVATSVDGIRALIGADELPAGGLVRIVTNNEIEVATISNVPASSGIDLNRLGNAARQIKLKEGTERVTLSSNVTRTVGFSRAHRVPWLIAVGLPIEPGAMRLAEGPGAIKF